MKTITVETTQKRQVIDITDLINKNLPRKTGVCNLLLTHTSAALTTSNLDPGTDQDILDALEKVVPHLKYRHPHDPAHAPDHILSSIIGTSFSAPFEYGELILGEWQRIILIELDGPRIRKIVISCVLDSES